MAISSVGSNARPGVCTSSTRPTSPFEGQLIYETDTNRVLIWEGAAWVMVVDTDQPPGMQLIASGTTASGGTVTIDNVFSADFKRYLVVLSPISISTSTDIRLRFRYGGSDFAGSSYYMGNIFAGAGISSNTETAQTSFRGIYTGNASYNAWRFEVFQPYVAAPTMVISQATGWDNTNVPFRSYGGFIDSNHQYTGFSIFGSGTISAEYAVYGYRN